MNNQYFLSHFRFKDHILMQFQPTGFKKLKTLGNSNHLFNNTLFNNQILIMAPILSTNQLISCSIYNSHSNNHNNEISIINKLNKICMFLFLLNMINLDYITKEEICCKREINTTRRRPQRALLRSLIR